MVVSVGLLAPAPLPVPDAQPSPHFPSDPSPIFCHPYTRLEGIWQLLLPTRSVPSGGSLSLSLRSMKPGSNQMICSVLRQRPSCIKPGQAALRHVCDGRAYSPATPRPAAAVRMEQGQAHWLKSQAQIRSQSQGSSNSRLHAPVRVRGREQRKSCKLLQQEEGVASRLRVRRTTIALVDQLLVGRAVRARTLDLSSPTPRDRAPHRGWSNSSESYESWPLLHCTPTPALDQQRISPDRSTTSSRHTRGRDTVQVRDCAGVVSES
jgi:hypothetical protein